MVSESSFVFVELWDSPVTFRFQSQIMLKKTFKSKLSKTKNGKSVCMYVCMYVCDLNVVPCAS